MQKRKIILDCETNSLEPDVVHCVVCKDIVSGMVFKFVQQECYTLLPIFLTNEVDIIIGHNLIEFDMPKVLKKLLGIDWPVEKCVDTYVLSRLSYSDRQVRDREKYGQDLERLPADQAKLLNKKTHSLAAYGIRFGRYKPEIDEWHTYTPEILHRCTEDVEITLLTYKYLIKELQGFSPHSIRLEHRIADIIAEQCRNGVYIDEKSAHDMYLECYAKAKQLRLDITQEIKPRILALEETFIEPRITETKIWTGEYVINEKTGRKIKKYDINTEISTHTKYYKYVTYDGKFKVKGAFTPIAIEYFNPDSPQQRLRVLEEAGWEPVNFNAPTEKMKAEGREQGNPLTTDEENLDTIPDDAPQGIKKLGLYLMHTNRYKLAEAWLSLRDKEGYVHGYVNSCGTPTGRMRHSNPNTANIVSVESSDGKPLMKEQGKYGYECRSCFSVKNPEQYELVGCDAASLEIRMLAHYMADPVFTDEVVNGDMYVYVQKLLGLPTRRLAKSILLAFIYGAGDAKLGKLLGGSKQQGRKVKADLLDALPALKELIQHVTKNAKAKGYLQGLDGRKLWVRKEHAALNLLLQSAGAIVMKQALMYAHKEIKSRGLGAKFVLNVHDEFQVSTLKAHSEEVGKILVDSIVKAGVFFKMNIPLGGDYKKGRHWGITH